MRETQELLRLELFHQIKNSFVFLPEYPTVDVKATSYSSSPHRMQRARREYSKVEL